ncbi:hypothetical protein G6011_05322 [Alternaria panax]|uniref:Uncharacterized protein n=1 Tax=Alternaria panax TaxID=48097 RepID=A0AAD4I860_9PLEO|nr:hypothetical protein G6011_05322 [Alternaria panax]
MSNLYASLRPHQKNFENTEALFNNGDEHMFGQDEDDDGDEMEADSVELGDGDETMGGVDSGDTQLLPIRKHQAFTASLVGPAIEAATVAATPSIVVESPTKPTAPPQDDDKPARSLRKKKIVAELLRAYQDEDKDKDNKRG